MSKPQVKDIIGGYELTWTPEHLRISVSRVKVHTSDGKVSGEILITNNGTAVYPQTSFNFTSERSRTQLIKTLTELDSNRSWLDIIGQLSLIIVERAREGETVRELWTNDNVVSPQYLIEPILYKGLPTIIFGEKAVCKSTLAIAIYACLTLPWQDNPLGWVVPEQPIKTLLVDYEVESEISHYNAKQIQRGMGLPAFPLFYRRCSLPLADDLEQIQKHMNKIEAKAIIIDSLGPAVGGDLKSAAEALRFTTALRQLKTTALIIGQTSKDTETKRKSVFGSVYFEYYSRNIIELRKVQEEGEESVDLALYNTYNNLGKRFRPQGFHIDFSEIGTQIERTEITSPELKARISLQPRILEILKGGTYSPKNLAAELDTSVNNILVALQKLKAKGEVTQPERGMYALSFKEKY